jgi:hypothetical protein
VNFHYGKTHNEKFTGLRETEAGRKIMIEEKDEALEAAGPQVRCDGLLNGKIFCCRTHGELMVKQWGEDLWVFYKHPDGQWVSMRKATDDDKAKVRELFAI